MTSGPGAPRLTIGEPRRISPAGERHWFPRLLRLPDGDVLQFNATVDDDNRPIAQPNSTAMRRSSDGGKTWRESATPPRYSFIHALDRGRLRSFTYILWQREGGGVRGWRCDSTDGGRTWSAEQEYAVDVPPIQGELVDQARMDLHRSVLRGRDGSLLASVEGRLVGDPKTSAHLIRSTDEGATWRLHGTIARGECPGREGWGEPTVARVADGSLVAILRTGGRDSSLHQCRSEDDGRTWSAPMSLGVLSVDPELCVMASGLLALSFGRPNVNLMLSPDGSARSWSEPTVIYRDPVANPRENSTCYTGMCEVAPGRLLMAYDTNSAGSPWEARDNQVNVLEIEVGG